MLALTIKTFSLVVMMILEVGLPNVSAMIIFVMIIALAVEQKHSKLSIFYHTFQFFFRVFGEFGSIDMFDLIVLLQAQSIFSATFTKFMSYLILASTPNVRIAHLRVRFLICRSQSVCNMCLPF